MDELGKAINSFVQDSYVTQGYGVKNPQFYGRGSHSGTDYHASKGTNVYGVAGWKVLDTYKDYNLGNVMVLQNPSTGESIRFAHLDKTLLKKGDIVPDNKTPVALSGGSGLTIGGKPQQEHLHVEYLDADGRLSDVTKANLFGDESRKAEANNSIVPSYQAVIDKFRAKPAMAMEGQPGLKTEDYTIQHGDSLSKIAQKYATDWQTLAKANPSIENPNLIYSGNTLKVPKSSSPIVSSKQSVTSNQTKPYSGNGYLIKSGDSLSKIARDLGVTVGTLMAKNNIENPNKIFAGKVLKY